MRYCGTSLTDQTEEARRRPSPQAGVEVASPDEVCKYAFEGRSPGCGLSNQSFRDAVGVKSGVRVKVTHDLGQQEPSARYEENQKGGEVRDWQTDRGLQGGAYKRQYAGVKAECDRVGKKVEYTFSPGNSTWIMLLGISGTYGF